MPLDAGLPTTFRISNFKHTGDTNPTYIEQTWSQLQDAIKTYTVTADKKYNELWSPASFNGSRSFNNVDSVCMLGIDIDKGVTSINEVKAGLDRLGVRYAIHSTHSSRRNADNLPKYRAFVPLRHAVNKSDYQLVWQWARDLTELPFDTAASDPCRMYFKPAVAPGEEHNFEFYVTGEELPLLDTNDIQHELDSYEVLREPTVDHGGDMIAVDDSTVEQVLGAALVKPHIKKLFDGDDSETKTPGDPSCADLTLCNKLATFLENQKELDYGRALYVADQIFRKSDLFRDKWDEKRASSTYGLDTLITAFKGRTWPELPTTEEVRKTVIFGHSLKELKRMEFPQEQNLIHGVSRGEVCTVVGVTDKGKTTYLRNLALSLASGREFQPLTFSTTPRKVIYFDAEDRLKRARGKLELMEASLTYDQRQLAAENLVILPAFESGWKLCDDALREELIAYLKEQKADVFMVDTLIRSVKFRNENDTAEANAVMEMFGQIALEADCIVPIACHAGKYKLEEGNVRDPVHLARGASPISDMPRTIFNLEYNLIDGTTKLINAKCKDEKFPPGKLLYNPTTGWTELVGAAEITNPYERIIAFLSDGKEHTVSEIVTAVEQPQSTVEKWLKKAVENSAVARVKRGVYQIDQW